GREGVPNSTSKSDPATRGGEDLAHCALGLAPRAHIGLNQTSIRQELDEQGGERRVACFRLRSVRAEVAQVPCASGRLACASPPIRSVLLLGPCAWLRGGLLDWLSTSRELRFWAVCFSWAARGAPALPPSISPPPPLHANRPRLSVGTPPPRRDLAMSS